MSQGTIGTSLTTKLAAEADRAAEVIPRAERLGYALHDLTRQLVDDRPEIDDDEIVEDSLPIERIASGKIWFEGAI